MTKPKLTQPLKWHGGKHYLAGRIAVQPVVIRELGEHAELRGQGLLARFLYAIPRSPLGSRDISARRPVPADVAFVYAELVDLLCQLAPGGDRSATLAPEYLRLTAGASARFLEFQVMLEPRLGSCGDLASMKDWGGKLAGAVIRLAGILHCVHEAETYLRQQNDRTRTNQRQSCAANRYQPWNREISVETILPHSWLRVCSCVK